MPPIKWEGHEGALINEIACFYRDGIYNDCCFLVEGRYMKGHKLILCASSPYFQKLFTNNSGKEPILLKDVKYYDFENIMKFIYYGVVDVPLNYIASFLQTAKILRIDALKAFLTTEVSIERMETEKSSNSKKLDTKGRENHTVCQDMPLEMQIPCFQNNSVYYSYSQNELVPLQRANGYGTSETQTLGSDGIHRLQGHTQRDNCYYQWNDSKRCNDSIKEEVTPENYVHDDVTSTTTKGQVQYSQCSVTRENFVIPNKQVWPQSVFGEGTLHSEVVIKTERENVFQENADLDGCSDSKFLTADCDELGACGVLPENPSGRIVERDSLQVSDGVDDVLPPVECVFVKQEIGTCDSPGRQEIDESSGRKTQTTCGEKPMSVMCELKRERKKFAMRHWRATRRCDPELLAQDRLEARMRYHQRKSEGKIKMAKELTPAELTQRRQKKREYSARRRAKQKMMMARVIESTTRCDLTGSVTSLEA